MLNFSMKKEKFAEHQSIVLSKVEFLTCNRNLPYGQNNVHVSQQEHKSLKYMRASSIFLGSKKWLTKQKGDFSKEKTTNI
jgi:hypothetical protein